MKNDVLQGDIYKKTLNGKSTVLSKIFLKLTSTDKEYHILHKNSQKNRIMTLTSSFETIAGGSFNSEAYKQLFKSFLKKNKTLVEES